MIKNIREKIVSATGSVSGITGVLGSWQVCHNLCLGIIVLLGIIGITVTGMPLLFLTSIAKPVWIVAVVLLIITLLMYIKRKCISKKLILFNSGLVIGGTPFEPIDGINTFYWVIGGVLALSGVLLFLNDKWRRK